MGFLAVTKCDTTCRPETVNPERRQLFKPHLLVTGSPCMTDSGIKCWAWFQLPRSCFQPLAVGGCQGYEGGVVAWQSRQVDVSNITALLTRRNNASHVHCLSRNKSNYEETSRKIFIHPLTFTSHWGERPIPHWTQCRAYRSSLHQLQRTQMLALARTY